MRSRVSAAFAAGGRPAPVWRCAAPLIVPQLHRHSPVPECGRTNTRAYPDAGGPLRADLPKVVRYRLVCQQHRTRISGSQRISVRPWRASHPGRRISRRGSTSWPISATAGSSWPRCAVGSGVTTGSFYHYFENWSAYTRALIEPLAGGAHPRAGEPAAGRPRSAPAHRRDYRRRADPATRRRSRDPGVERDRPVVLRRPGRGRPATLRRPLGFRHGASRHDDRQAQLFASWAMYLLVGYEQSTLPPDTVGLAWIAAQLMDALDSGRFSSVPPG